MVSFQSHQYSKPEVVEKQHNDENDVLFSNDTGRYSEKEILSSHNRGRTYDLPNTSSDALPLSYRRLVGAKAIKLGS